MGLIGVNSTSETRTPSSAVFIEYYTYRAAGEPKFVLQPSDGFWFQHFTEEAEELWESSAACDLTSPLVTPPVTSNSDE